MVAKSLSMLDFSAKSSTTAESLEMTDRPLWVRIWSHSTYNVQLPINLHVIAKLLFRGIGKRHYIEGSGLHLKN